MDVELCQVGLSSGSVNWELLVISAEKAPLTHGIGRNKPHMHVLHMYEGVI